MCWGVELLHESCKLEGRHRFDLQPKRQEEDIPHPLYVMCTIPKVKDRICKVELCFISICQRVVELERSVTISAFTKLLGVPRKIKAI